MKWRGHAIVEIDAVWIYADTGQLVSASPMRDCGHCGLKSTSAGHDGCLGELAGVANACCGHGSADDAYVQFDDGSVLRGDRALHYFDGR